MQHTERHSFRTLRRQSNERGSQPLFSQAQVLVHFETGSLFGVSQHPSGVKLDARDADGKISLSPDA